jgi:glycosyltransferase involved in cell wall biosynthesis
MDVEVAGGAEVQQAMLARTLKAVGYRVSVLTGNHGQSDLVNCDGIEVHALPPAARRGFKGLRFIYPSMTDIVSGLSRINPDIVYFRVAGFRAAAVSWYALSRSKRFVYACASDREFRGRSVSQLSRRDDFLFRMALRSADLVLVQNKQQQEQFHANFGREAVIVPNCYIESGAGRADYIGPIVWVGTFKPIKRPELFIDLARQFPSRRFVMVGGADSANDPGQAFHRRMRAMADEVENLEFIGYVPFAEVGRYFDNASLFVNTSDSEGFPNTLLQAWIRGIPTLSFVRPEVIPGVVGTIVCRDISDMTLRMEALIANREAWEAASEACETHFHKNHSVDVVLKHYRDLFQCLSVPRVRPE